MKTNKSIRLALAAASCALLIEQPVDAADSNAWVVDFGTLFYQEKNRVSIFEPMMIATNNFNEEDFVSFRLVNDTMSGASPNGAAVSSQSQTIPAHSTTSASGSSGTISNTVISPYATPLNDFSDQRNSIGADWQKAYSRTFRSILGLNLSSENDYSSLGGSVTFQRDTEDKLTTFTLGLSFSSDTIQPGGGIPQGLSLLSSSTGVHEDEEDDEHEHEENDDSEDFGEQKQLNDLLVGITQVISRRVLTQLNYSIGQSSGYLTDPYKIVSRIDSTTGETIDYLSEKRPGGRIRQAIFWKTVIHLPSDVVNLSYRYYWDDWSIQAHTAEIKYRFNIGDHFYLMPNFRYYTQTGASFFKHSLLSDAPLPQYASADLRLAPMQATTTGLKIGYNFGGNTEISFRAASMQQWGDNHPPEAIGIQKEAELFPKLEVMMYTLEFSMDL